MNSKIALGLIVPAIVFLAACAENLDPLSPGSMKGQYALGMKALVPLSVGNNWKYNVTLYDTSGIVRTRYSYSLSVKDTITADTSMIPTANKKSLGRSALTWYVVQGELGMTSCWQVDSLENLRTRKSDDTRFFEQTAFNFRASLGDVTPLRFIGADTVLWASGDQVITGADSVKTTIVSKGVDTLRTTLGSAPYFKYRQSYVRRTDYTDYYFKPGFGLFLVEKFQKKSDGTMVRIRRDELISYFFN
ncbi:MAG: hypothetical protein NTV54_14500 [Ignavibacteriales bacterium]|nr:hypothetical protein [Ignavibacteriales bacterium]